MKNKQAILAVMVGLVLILGLALVAKAKRPQSQTNKALPTLAPTPTPIRVNSLPSFDLDYTNEANTLSLKLNVPTNFWNQFAKVTYEFMYTSTNGPRGLIGEFNPEFTTDKVFLGSESSGKRVYDTGIETGQITLHLEKENGDSTLIGPYDIIFGGWVYNDSWQTETMSLKLDKKTKAKFIVYQNSSSPNLTDNLKMIISFKPAKLKQPAKLKLKTQVDIKKIQHNHEAVAFSNEKDSLELNLTSAGDYLIY